MKLPSAHLALVAEDKITGYLLNAAHRFGASKARFFADFGFRVEEWETLAAALREHGQRHEVIKVTETGFGPVTTSTVSWTRPMVAVRGCGRSGKWTAGKLRRG
jgi:hypothetical protein